MLGGLLVVILSGVASFAIIDALKRRYPFIDARFLKKLFFYHLFLALVYYIYVLFNPSDSRFYYAKIISDYRGPTWLDFYGVSTPFIEFVGYPFIVYLGFSYEAIMALFSFLGFLGVVYFYILIRENISFKHDFLGTDLFKLIFLLPNLHFWSSSFGKGSIIFLGLGLFFYGISNIGKRIIPIVIGGLIVYHVRPHVMLVVLVSSAIGFVFSTRRISVVWRILFLAGACVAFFFIYQDVLTLVGINEDEFISQGLDLTHRASELTNATSGVDITKYSLPMQLFTFLYRPLFIDAPGFLGIIVSFENLFYLLITIFFFSSLGNYKHLFTGGFLVKSAFLSFITVSVALAQVSGNLGLAMRQKSQVMILFMFVVISALDERKLEQWRFVKRRRLLKQRLERNMQVQKTAI
jgi:hypothetical protein